MNLTHFYLLKLAAIPTITLTVLVKQPHRGLKARVHFTFAHTTLVCACCLWYCVLHTISSHKLDN